MEPVNDTALAKEIIQIRLFAKGVQVFYERRGSIVEGQRTLDGETPTYSGSTEKRNRRSGSIKLSLYIPSR